MKEYKTYEVSLNWSHLVEAENEEEAKEEVSKVFDSSLLKLDVKEEDGNTTLKINFKENLSDGSIKMIKDILKNSLQFDTEITEI